ncbi:hypothetical protein [Streptomyces anandii]|uniref:hypothetical protein n=1 Tax=Streptomyces anandii TaxID=285454 RepID=UPI00369BB48A
MAIPGPFNPSGTAMSLADAIRAQADSQAKQAAQKSGLVETTDPLQQLMKQIQSINTPATPYDVLLNQAQGTAGAQFDPLIAELQGQIKSTTNRGHNNQKQAEQMYNALAQDIASQMPEITNQMSQASKETENRYDQTQQALQGEYDKQASNQAALLQKLGIQAAAPEASQQAMDDQAYFQQQSKSDEANALALLNEMKNADVSYNRQSADNTRLAGVNTAQDIGAQLEDYLQQANSKLGGLKAGRESAIQSALAQLQQQDQARVDKQNETQYSHLMDLFNLQLKMQQMQQQQNQSLFKGTNGPSGASNYLSGIYGNQDSFSSKAIMDAINDVMADPNVIAGKYDSGNKDMYGNPVMNQVNDQYMIDLLRKRLSDEGSTLSGSQFSAGDINNAINALLAYQGKLK